MSIDVINFGYVFTLFISFSAIISATAILYLGTKRKQHYFADKKWSYVALNASAMINVFFIYNILLWLSDRYVEIQDLEFHVRWLIYHTFEKTAIFMFHHELFMRVRRWRKKI